MKHRLITLLLLFAVPTAFFSACSDKNIRTAAEETVAGLRDVSNILSANWPPGDPRLPKIRALVAAAAQFEADLKANADPLTLLPALSLIVKSFRQEVIPVLGGNTNLIIAASLVDAGLRILSRRFTKEAEKVSKRPGTVSRGATVKRAENDLETLRHYLKSEKVKK